MSQPDRQEWLRVAGWFELGSATTIWSVAEGRRGRRWRTSTRDGGASRSMLLELDPNGRPTRLELASPAGILTAHPEPSQATLHGNVVAADGVRPITLPWQHDQALIVAGEPISLAAAIDSLRRQAPGSPTGSLPAAEITADLRVQPVELIIHRETPAVWRVEQAGSTANPPIVIGLDADGLLRTIDGARVGQVRWSLEDE